MFSKKERFLKKALNTLPKLQKDELIRLSQNLISERALFLQILEQNPRSIIVFKDNFPIYQNKKAQDLFQDIPQFILSKNTVGILSLLDKFQIDRVLEIEYVENEGYDFFYIKDLSKNYEKELKEKTKEGLDSLENLAAGIAHEIKNPLSAIDIYTQLIKRKIKKKTLRVPEEIENFIKIVQHESKRLLSILNKFLNKMRQQDPNLIFIEISDVIQNTINVFESELNDKKIQYKTVIYQVPKIFSDPDLLQQIISDLLRNAIEALDESEKKELTVSLEEDESKNNLIISIDDSGKGIPHSIKNKILEPYFTTKKNGTGLGLTLVNKMIKEVGGCFLIGDSSLGGTSCQIILPISQGQKKLSYK